jgi:hypothetical protein
MEKQQVLRLIREYLDHHRSNGVTIEILERAVRHDGDWWYVPVRPSGQVPKTYRYYEELTDVETELKDKEHIDVLLVPAA